MSCPAENTWLAYVGGELDLAEIDRLDRHLDGCPSCRLIYADLAQQGRRGTGAAPAGAGPAGEAAEELARGTLVGRYVVLGVIGRGGMGVVYKAFDPELDRAIALKLVAVPGTGGGPDAMVDALRRRLQREARTLARLSHPNVVAVHDVGALDGSLFVAMEFVSGRTLRRWLNERPRRPREILSVFLDAGAGLAAAHRLGIVHRDFKPDNVMVSDDGRVRVLDFGLARSEDAASEPAQPPRGTTAGGGVAGGAAGGAADGAAAPAADPALTRDGAVMGTPAYMAPEQDRGEGADARTDQFSFCAALYEALYRQRPFAGRSYAELAKSRASGEPSPAPALRGVSKRARRALLRGLRADPVHRHADMDQLLAGLSGGSWLTRPRTAVAALAVVGLAAAGWATWVARHAPPSIAATCARAGHDVDSIWTPARRARVAAQIGATGHDRPAAAGKRLVHGVDDWTHAWAVQRSEACKLSLRSDLGQESHVADRVQCLERVLGRLDASLVVLTSARDPALIDGAASMLEDLPRPETCRDAATINPSSADKKRLEPVIRDLMQAKVALARNDVGRAMAEARKAVAMARATYPDSLSAALLLLGQSQAQSGDRDAARATLRQAAVAAAKIKEDGIVADSWLSMVSLDISGYHIDAQTEEALFGAELAVARLPADDSRRALLPTQAGAVHIFAGDLERAESELDQALATWRSFGADKSAGQIAAVEQALGLVHAFEGRWQLSRRELMRSLAVWKRFGPNPLIGMTEGFLGTSLEIQRRHDEASAMYLRSLTDLTNAPGVTPTNLGVVAFNLGFSYARAGRCDAAAPYLSMAQVILAVSDGPDSAVYGLTQLGRGLCALERGRTAQAVELLEEARRHAGAFPASPVQVPLTDFALARALVRRGGQRARALTLAREARDRLAHFGGFALDLAEVETFLATESGGDAAHRDAAHRAAPAAGR